MLLEPALRSSPLRRQELCVPSSEVRITPVAIRIRSAVRQFISCVIRLRSGFENYVLQNQRFLSLRVGVTFFYEADYARIAAQMVERSDQNITISRIIPLNGYEKSKRLASLGLHDDAGVSCTDSPHKCVRQPTARGGTLSPRLPMRFTSEHDQRSAALAVAIHHKSAERLQSPRKQKIKQRTSRSTMSTS